MDNLKDKFTATYKNNSWGSQESFSGGGSEWNFAQYYAENFLSIIKKYNIKSIFDTSCGDWNWMNEIKDKLPNYIGNDIVEDLIKVNKEKYESETIKFVCGDMIESLKIQKNIDLVVCRHTLEHLPTDYIINFLNILKNNTKYALITSGNWHGNELLNINFDGRAARTINLDMDVFKSILGEPIEKFRDHPSEKNLIGTFGYLYKF